MRRSLAAVIVATSALGLMVAEAGTTHAANPSSTTTTTHCANPAPTPTTTRCGRGSNGGSPAARR